MITVKTNQRIFTHAEVASLTGICVEHLRTAAKRFRSGFIARAQAATQADEWLFTPWDLDVLVTLLPRCTHQRRTPPCESQRHVGDPLYFARMISLAFYLPLRP